MEDTNWLIMYGLNIPQILFSISYDLIKIILHHKYFSA